MFHEVEVNCHIAAGRIPVMMGIVTPDSHIVAGKLTTRWEDSSPEAVSFATSSLMSDGSTVLVRLKQTSLEGDELLRYYKAK